MTPFEIIQQVKQRTSEAIVSQSRFAHDGLRQYLREMLSGDQAREGALLQQLLIEGAHPFVTADISMGEAAGSILHPDLVSVLDALPAEHDYRFPRDRRPFRHQAEAWRYLSEPSPRSVLVTSGTGSGKTECFLFPILSDLARQVHGKREPLQGVQAIMLYPLNALIESQRERLSAWMQPFGGKLRYCLYNGDLPQSSRESERRARPEVVIDREQLRNDPAPLLVTNVTMLEYMLVRAQDQPIIKASRGQLKWIVLDEAHSLVGAAAAEIALLLRRVMLAFDVSPEDVRFVATSATIGSGESMRRQLQRFLADVAGVKDEQVTVIEGARQMPARPAPGSTPAIPLLEATPQQLYDRLGRDPLSWSLVERLHSGGVEFSELKSAAAQFGSDAATLLFSLSRAARQLPDGREERLCPVRLHAFERAVPGFWSCVNPDCTPRPEGWRFGRIYPERADACPSCSAPVLEILSCGDCGEVYLSGVENRGRLSAPLRNPPRDEFAADSARDSEPDATDEDGDESPVVEGDAVPDITLDRLFAANPTKSARPVWLNRHDDWKVEDLLSEGGLTLLSEDTSHHGGCPNCCNGSVSNTQQLRPLRFGAPFIIGNAAPILLEGVEPAQPPGGEPLPSSGRRLLSFTDSRQGTARMAARLQTEAERNFVRSFIYHQVQASLQPSTSSAAEVTKLQEEIAELKKLDPDGKNPMLQGFVAEREAKLLTLTGGSTEGIAWGELVRRLSERLEVSAWISETWQARDEVVFQNATRVAEFLLLRELNRRPRTALSIETLGLAKLRHPAIEQLGVAQIPGALSRRGKHLADWKAYLDAVHTHFVRNHACIAIDAPLFHWISHRTFRNSLIGPDQEADSRKQQRWPSGHRNTSWRSRPVALLVAGLNLNLAERSDRDDVDECLQAAWRIIQQTFSLDPERKVFDFSKAFVAPVLEAFHCPVTRGLLDHAPFGLTPYGRAGFPGGFRPAAPVVMPRHPLPLLGIANLGEARNYLREWIEKDPIIADLRARGAWNNISDRIALFADYARSAEHSAQQDGPRLRDYERKFKAGTINILNCSTTMEMGVDIGSVSSVMMTNVPPSIANYRQRVGRAGRRGQSIALAFTFCKDRPLDQEVFRDPAAFLRRNVAAPKVTLTSRPIVQRHVNAFLLSGFMHQQAGNLPTMQIGDFLGCPTDLASARPAKADRPVEAFLAWLSAPSTEQAFADGLTRLTARTVLESDRTLISETRTTLEHLQSEFTAEWEGLRALARDEKSPQAGVARMIVELKRLCGEFLLSSLADRGFLPGHGFPTDVVSFIPGKEFRATAGSSPDGARQAHWSGPQRSLDLAIRDYAPGSEVVLDGLVYRSAGVTLNWKRPANEENVAEIQSLRKHWRCDDCGASGTRGPSDPTSCGACGAPHTRAEEFLRPAGFSVDPREQAHDDTSLLSYVPPEDPDVSTCDAPWQNLPLPELGRFRSSREGSVYYSNRGGPRGYGYAICLECGRAEADIDNSGVASPLPALAGHKPLRIRRDQDICPGNHKPFSIKRNLALGFEVMTDVFELQPRHMLRRAAANALAIALREALAQELGIEADEMGFSVAKTRNELGGEAASLFLFDRATGGGGFATSFETLLRPVLDRAQRILDCATPGCERACAACVLTLDAPSGKDELDRKGALEFLRTQLALPVQLPVADSFVPDAELSLSPIDEIDRQLRRTAGAALTIFLPEGSTLAELQNWPLAGQFLGWTLRGHPVALAVTSFQLSSLTPADRLALRDFVMAHHIGLFTAEAPVFSNGSRALACISLRDSTSFTWASRDPVAACPGPCWGRPDTLAVAQGKTGEGGGFAEVDLDTLLPPGGAQFVEIGSEFDGSLSRFGDLAAKSILQAVEKCGGRSGSPVARITYRDGYVCSPLVSRLLIDTVHRIAAASGAKEAALVVHTKPPRTDPQRRAPSLIGNDWEDGTTQIAVIEELALLRGLQILVRHENVPHGRFMEIEFKDGSSAMVVLDQGFGAWAPPPGRPIRCDFSLPPASQAKWLSAFDVGLQRRGAGKTYMVVSRKQSAPAHAGARAT